MVKKFKKLKELHQEVDAKSRYYYRSVLNQLLYDFSLLELFLLVHFQSLLELFYLTNNLEPMRVGWRNIGFWKMLFTG